MSKKRADLSLLAQPPKDYWLRSQTPLASLFFLLPLLVIYELGVMIVATDYANGLAQHIKARLWLLAPLQSLGLGGQSGYLMSGVVVVSVLIGWHWVRKDKWDFQIGLYLWMAVESLLWAVPLLLFMMVFSRPAMQAAISGGASGHHLSGIVFSLGAGIFEELLFRLILITLLHDLCTRGLKIPDATSSMIAIALSALAFGFYHFALGQGGQSIDWSLLALYSVAGIFLAFVFVLRGIGIAAGTHASYDLLVLAYRMIF